MLVVVVPKAVESYLAEWSQGGTTAAFVAWSFVTVAHLTVKCRGGRWKRLQGRAITVANGARPWNQSSQLFTGYILQ